MDFDLEYKLQQFREVEKDYFDENNERYSTKIGKESSEMMLQLINELECALAKAETDIRQLTIPTVTTRFSTTEIENVMQKVKKAKISPRFKQILQIATGDSYDSTDDKAFLDKYTGKVANVYEWAGDWWIAEDDNYVITEDCFTII